MQIFRFCAVLAMMFAAPCLGLAEPLAEIYTAPGVRIESVGVYCNLNSAARIEAPETDLGFVELLPTTPALVSDTRSVPARLGLMFGLVYATDWPIAEIRNEGWRPGAIEPDIWYSQITADRPLHRGFRFDYEQELIPGIWRMEAFDGTTLLFSVEFEVLPGTELPGLSSNCTLTS